VPHAAARALRTSARSVVYLLGRVQSAVVLSPGLAAGASTTHMYSTRGDHNAARPRHWFVSTSNNVRTLKLLVQAQ
jgi:hypothetical protein